MSGIEGFQGPVLERGDDGYDQARAIWNGAIDRRPATIARCTGTADVMAAVRHARSRELRVSVRSGGHGVGGLAVADGALMIDLSLMKGIHVDPAGRTARAQAGVLWGELDHETQAFALATTGGIVTHTGIAGLTLGGGIGWLMRTYGLTIDNLLSVDVVTADGELVRASANENADLFWGMCGAGSNFGIVTSFEYRLHPVGPTVLAGPIFWPMEDTPEVLRFYRDYITTVPDEFASIVNLRKAPPLPVIPEELHGRPVCGVLTFFAGSIEEGAEVMRPLRAFGSPLVDLVGPKPYVAYQALFNPGVPHGWHYYWKSLEVAWLKDEIIDRVAAHSLEITSSRSYTLIFQLGGAIGRVPEDATAYSHRDAGHAFNINGVWLPDDSDPDVHVDWARRTFSALEEHQIGVYVNFLGDEGEARVRAAYGEEKYGRLTALKDRYDPDNFFRLNQNIKPSQRA